MICLPIVCTENYGILAKYVLDKDQIRSLIAYHFTCNYWQTNSWLDPMKQENALHKHMD